MLFHSTLYIAKGVRALNISKAILVRPSRLDIRLNESESLSGVVATLSMSEYVTIFVAPDLGKQMIHIRMTSKKTLLSRPVSATVSHVCLMNDFDMQQSYSIIRNLKKS